MDRRGRLLLGAVGAACSVASASVALVLVLAPAASAGERMLIEVAPMKACDAAGRLRAAGAATVSARLGLFTLEKRASDRLLPSLRACGAVRYAAADRPAGTLSVTDFADPLVNSAWWRAAIGVVDLAPPGPGKPITIIDSGVNVAHPEFAGRANLVMLNAQEPAPLGGVHGTAVASVIGAEANGVGIVGIYPQAVLQSWDSAVGTGTKLASSEIVRGLLAAASGAPGVINLSLGGEGIEIPIQQAVATAVSKGMLVVAAAGNDGDSTNVLTYPASFPHVLTVGATNPQGQLAPFSSRSRYVDLAAPGQGIVVAGALSQSWEPQDGTSFSSPLVAGAAAWVWTVRPDLDASQLFEVMRRSAVDIAPAGRDDATGFGLLNVPAALRYPAPIKDSPEPNDDLEFVRPGGMYYNGLPVLTSRSRLSAVAVGRLASIEDPRDLYPVFVPQRGTLTVKTASAPTTDLALWAATTATVTEAASGNNRLARGRTQGVTETLTFTNPGAGRTVYLSVSLATRTLDATYRVAVAAR